MGVGVMYRWCLKLVGVSFFASPEQLTTERLKGFLYFSCSYLQGFAELWHRDVLSTQPFRWDTALQKGGWLAKLTKLSGLSQKQIQSEVLLPKSSYH